MKNPDSLSRPAFLVVGGDGLIGAELVRALRTITPDVYTTSRRPDACEHNAFLLDLDGNQNEFFSDARIQKLTSSGRLTAFICAAITKISECEQDTEHSRRVNVTNTVELGEKLLSLGVRVVFISSNAVFSGLEMFPGELATPNPNTNYGRQKAEAEQGLLSAHASLPDAPPLMIVRLTKVLSRTAPLIEGWIKSLRAGLQISAFEDRRLSPISLDFVVKRLIKIVDHGKAGIYHVTGAKDLSYYEFACLLASSIGVDKGLVIPVVADKAVAGLVQRCAALGGTAEDLAMALDTEDPGAVVISLLS